MRWSVQFHEREKFVTARVFADGERVGSLVFTKREFEDFQTDFRFVEFVPATREETPT